MTRLLARVLSMLTDPPLADAIAGDLTEERARRAGRSRARAALWFWGASLALASRVLVGRVLTAIRRGGLQSLASRLGFGGRRECRQAVRSLSGAPWYSLTVIGVIALGMALLTTVFAVVDGVLFKPLPYPEADRLMFVDPGFKGLTRFVGRAPASPRDVADWSAAIPEVRFTGFNSNNGRLPTGDGVNETSATMANVDRQFFDTIGVRPLMGGFTEEHFARAGARRAPGIAMPVIVSYELWQSRYGGDAGILGRRVTVQAYGGVTLEIVGVMPQGFVFPGPVNTPMIVPMIPRGQSLSDPRGRMFDCVVARVPAGLAPGVLADRIEAAMKTTAADFPPSVTRPGDDPDRVKFHGPFDQARVQPLTERLRAGQRPISLAVFLAGAVLLLLASVNVSGLVAARNETRRRELAVRRALGAAGWAIARLVLVEAFLLVAAGTALGVASSPALLHTIVRLLPDDLHLLKTPAIDWRVAGFACLATVVSTLCVALWPIRQSLSVSVAGSIADGARASRKLTAYRRAVVAVEVALGLVLTVGGALVVGSLARIWTKDVGFDPSGVTAIQLGLAGDPSKETGAAATALVDDVRAVPGVRAAGLLDNPLLVGSMFGGWLVPATPREMRKDPLWVETFAVSIGALEALSTRLVGGRMPTAGEFSAGTVVVVTENTARDWWPGGNPIGQQVVASSRGGPDVDPVGRRFTVVGVVADARYDTWEKAPFGVVYGPYPLLALTRSPTLLVKIEGPTGLPLKAVLARLEQAKPAVRAVRVTPLGDVLADSIRPRRFQSWLFGSFGAAALLLLCVGVFGLLAMTAAQRTRELGIRMALGATRQAVVALFLREQAVSVGIGLVVGAAVSAWVVTFLKAYVFEFTVYDVRLWAVAILAIVVTAGVGALIPSRRASRLDPIVALRVD